MVCFFKDRKTEQPAKIAKFALVNFCVSLLPAQYAFVWTFQQGYFVRPLRYRILKALVACKYFYTRWTVAICSGIRFDEYQPSVDTTKPRSGCVQMHVHM